MRIRGLHRCDTFQLTYGGAWDGCWSAPGETLLVPQHYHTGLKGTVPFAFQNKQNLLKILTTGVPQNSDRPIFQLLKQRKCVSAVTTQNKLASHNYSCSSKDHLRSEEKKRMVIKRGEIFKYHFWSLFFYAIEVVAGQILPFGDQCFLYWVFLSVSVLWQDKNFKAESKWKYRFGSKYDDQRRRPQLEKRNVA